MNVTSKSNAAHFTGLLLAGLILLAPQHTQSQILAPRMQMVVDNIAGTFGSDASVVEAYAMAAIRLEEERNIPAAVTIGIAILESGGFTSELFQESGNPFGIKASSGWSGPVFRKWHDAANTPFRVYNSPDEAMQDFGNFLYSRSWYRDAFFCGQDVDCFISGLVPRQGEPGYSIDPRWHQKLTNIIYRFELEALMYQPLAYAY